MARRDGNLKPRRTWTLPELREAAAAYAAGSTWSAVGARYGVSGSCVRTLIRRYGIPVPKRVPHEPTSERAQLLYRAAALKNTEGLSWALIAERVGWDRSPQALYVAVKRYGINYTEGYPSKRRPR